MKSQLKQKSKFGTSVYDNSKHCTTVFSVRPIAASVKRWLDCQSLCIDVFQDQLKTSLKFYFD